jgi:hypothetical protein
MQPDRGIIETICEGGAGGEARVLVQLRTEFPGIGGTILTQEGVASALREEYNPSPKAGHRMFLRHAIIKKLDDYFHRTGLYVYAHVARPLASISRRDEGPRGAYEAYIYEWAFGSDRFPWETALADGSQQQTILHDWGKFVSSFAVAGIALGNDVTDPDDGRIAQNIVHQFPYLTGGQRELSCLWKRIDFGFNSITIDFERLVGFLDQHRERLIRVLRFERFDLLVLALEYLADGQRMSDADVGRLDVLIGNYRVSSLRHVVATSLGVSGEVAPVYLGERSESL